MISHEDQTERATDRGPTTWAYLHYISSTYSVPLHHSRDVSVVSSGKKLPSSGGRLSQILTFCRVESRQEEGERGQEY